MLIRTNAITGIQLMDDPSAPFTCDLCDYAKLTQKPIHKEWQAPLAKAFRDEVHTDVWGASFSSKPWWVKILCYIHKA